jgi:hypothetical protein
MSCAPVNVLVGTAVTIMGRFTDPRGVPYVQADLSAIEWGITDTTTNQTIATGPFVLSDVWYDTLQTGGGAGVSDPPWTTDSTGYNFLATLPGAQFQNADDIYMIEIEITPNSGDPIAEVWTIKLQYRPDAIP